MKATAQTLSADSACGKSAFAVLCELVKARLTFLVVLTTLVGFQMGTRGSIDWWLMLRALAGTTLLACGAAALNQLWEREHDARMRRTESRPLPSRRMTPQTVLIFGGACSVAGLVYLAVAVNLLTALLGAATLVSYVFIYTPLKRITWLNTAVGAVPGALPPLMGWTAARGELSIEGWSLFAILFFWQIPHFFAIAWLYREEYEKAGFVMLPSLDPDGSRTGRQAVSHTLGLLMVSLTPFVFRLAGSVYLLGALVLGLIFLGFAILFSMQLTRARARQLFFASILYLPLLLSLMVIDKLKH
ncbi:MAG: heme o synthase [Verrucomicrobiota bacterium]|jgi:protoheme IX farnesyltransferase